MNNIVVPQTPLRYPDFFCIGAQKAGTTWLHKMLSQRNDVWLPPVKELHYFDLLHLDWLREAKSGRAALDAGVMRTALRTISRTMNKPRADAEMLKRIYSLSLAGTRELTDEWYGRIFQSAHPQSLCGEITPSYALLPDKGIEHIVALKADVKIIFIMRDPIERGWSALRMKQKKQGETSTDDELRRKADSKEFFNRADYLGTIERFRRHVGDENFLPLYFDNLTEQPHEFLEEVCDFLKLPTRKRKFSKADNIVHKGQSKVIEPELYDRLRTNLEPAYKRLRTLENPIVEKWYQAHYG